MPMDMTGFDPVVRATAELLTFGRERLFTTVEGLTEAQLHAVPAGLTNSIATLLLHLGGTEVGFAHLILGQTLSDELKSAYKRNVPQKPLPAAEGETLDSLKAKLAQSLGYMEQAMRSLTAADLDREIALGTRTLTVRELLKLAGNHQSQHLGQIQIIKQLV